jgi:hypothetical protein
VYVALTVPVIIRLHALARVVDVGGLEVYARMVAWELPILLPLAALHEYGRRLESAIVRIPIRLLIIGAWLILLADAMVFRVFDLRLAFPDVIRYGSRAADIVSFFDPRAVVAAVGAVAVFLLIQRKWAGLPREPEAHTQIAAVKKPLGSSHLQRLSWRAGFPVVIVAGLTMGSTLTPTDDGDLYAWRVQNWLSLTTQNSLYRSYSPAFLESLKLEAVVDRGCDALEGPEPRPDILIVLLA